MHAGMQDSYALGRIPACLLKAVIAGRILLLLNLERVMQRVPSYHLALLVAGGSCGCGGVAMRIRIRMWQLLCRCSGKTWYRCVCRST